MNTSKAKRGIGALVGIITLLLAAAFIIAPAVADENIVSLGDVYLNASYDSTTGLAPVIIKGNETWTNGDNTLTFVLDEDTMQHPDEYHITGNNLTEGTYTRTIGETTYSLNLKGVDAGTIIITSAPEVVYIGNEFTLEGTNSLGGLNFFFIKGTNYPFQPIRVGSQPICTAGQVWNTTIEPGILGIVDAGIYTIYVASLTNEGQDRINNLTVADLDNPTYVNTYNSTNLAFLQPFITITKAPSVLAHGDKLEVEGIAEGEPDVVQYYIFGTNYFRFGTAAVNGSKFTVELRKDETMAEQMATGQYYLVIQHPMSDKYFNIGAVTENSPGMLEYYRVGDIVMNRDGSWNDPTSLQSQILFNVNIRHSANAAQGLCDALDSQYIDDTYSKVSIAVLDKTSRVDAIPSTVTKGQIFTVSGSSIGLKGETVSVELASAAVLQEQPGLNSTYTRTTKIRDDGRWSISIDTSAFNAGVYTCSVAVGQHSAVTATITIQNPGSVVPGIRVYIPTYVVKGTPLTISGVAFEHSGEKVTGKLTQTGVADIPLPQTTVGADGIWSVTLDTTGLSTGSYTCTVQIGTSYSTTKDLTIVSEEIAGFSNLNSNLSGSLLPGDIVTTTGEMTIPRDAASPSSKLSLNTGLVGASWTVDIMIGNRVLSTKHLTDPYCYLTGFDISFDVDIVLRFTVTGVVPSASAGRSISVMQVRKEGMPYSGPQSYATPEQYVYNVGNLNVELTLLKNALSTMDTRNAYYKEQGCDVRKAQNYTNQSRAKYDAAVAAGSANPRVAFENIYAGFDHLPPAKMELAEVSLNLSHTYITAVEADIVVLTARGYDTEALLVVTKNAGLKNTYAQLLSIYSIGILPDTVALDKLAADTLALHKEALEYIGESQEKSMKLSAGWNFVSVPKKLSAAYDTAAELFTGVNTSGKAILSYNAQTKAWEQVKADTIIAPLTGYWIYSTGAKNITPTFDTGVHTPATKKLYEGWNAVGLSAEKAMSASAVFNNLNWRTYLAWAAAKQEYENAIIKGGTGKYSDESRINLWKGGWVYMDADGTYIGYA